MQRIALVVASGATAVILGACDSGSTGRVISAPATQHRSGSLPGGGKALELGAHGTIVGAFRIVGGPAPGMNRPLRGTIDVHEGSATGRVVTTSPVPPSGRFTILVEPGSFVLVGRTPQITGPGGGCPAFHPVTVTPGQTVHVRVICEVP